MFVPQVAQVDDGHWPGDYGGPLFLMPGLIIACRFCSIDLGAARRAAMTQYLSRHQNADGGWGIHIEVSRGGQTR